MSNAIEDFKISLIGVNVLFILGNLTAFSIYGLFPIDNILAQYFFIVLLVCLLCYEIYINNKGKVLKNE